MRHTFTQTIYFFKAQTLYCLSKSHHKSPLFFLELNKTNCSKCIYWKKQSLENTYNMRTVFKVSKQYRFISKWKIYLHQINYIVNVLFLYVWEIILKKLFQLQKKLGNPHIPSVCIVSINLPFIFIYYLSTTTTPQNIINKH